MLHTCNVRFFARPPVRFPGSISITKNINTLNMYVHSVNSLIVLLTIPVSPLFKRDFSILYCRLLQRSSHAHLQISPRITKCGQWLIKCKPSPAPYQHKTATFRHATRTLPSIIRISEKLMPGNLMPGKDVQLCIFNYSREPATRTHASKSLRIGKSGQWHFIKYKLV